MLTALIYAALVFLVDQSSKQVVRRRLQGVSWGGFVQFRLVGHRERFYARSSYRAVLVVIWCLAMVSAVWLHRSGLWLQGRFAVAGMGCALGGAAGNLAEILRQQQVTDFIDLGWWPVFNLADVAIVVGLVLAFWG
jgi:signal peptidase II